MKITRFLTRGGGFDNMESPDSRSIMSGRWKTGFLALVISTDLTANDQTPPPRAVAPRSAVGTSPLALGFVENRGQFEEAVRYQVRARRLITDLKDDGFRFWVPVPSSTRQHPRALPSPREFECTELVFSSPAQTITALEPRATRVNYFKGGNPENWRVEVPTFDAVHYRGMATGADVLARCNDRIFEYDFVLQPGFESAEAIVEWRGARSVALKDDGTMVVRMRSMELVHTAPTAIEVRADGERVEIPCAVDRIDEFRFRLSATGWRPGSSVILDPKVIPQAEYYYSYFGGDEADIAFDVAVSGAHTIVVGMTVSASPETTWGNDGFPAGTSIPGASVFDDQHNGDWDAYVARIDSLGQVMWCTYVGGEPGSLPGNFDVAKGVDIDAAGSVYVCGFTNVDSDVATCVGSPPPPCPCPPAPESSPGSGQGVFPTTGGAFQTTDAGAGDGFVFKLTAAGSCLSWSTLLGGSNEDTVEDIRVDAFGNSFVTGYTDSSSNLSVPFPVSAGTPGPVESTSTGSGSSKFAAFCTKLAPDGASLVYSTFLGGAPQLNRAATRGLGIAIHEDAVDPSKVFATIVGDVEMDDPDGATYVFPSVNPIQTGLVQGDRHGMIVRLNETGSQYLYSTMYGGLGFDTLTGCDVSATGVIAACGWTFSDANLGLLLPNAFQATNGCAGCSPTADCRDAWIVRIDPSKTGTAALLSASLAGGCNDDEAHAVALDSSGAMWVTGFATTSFPVNAGTSTVNGTRDIFVMKIGRGGTKEYARLFGGSQAEYGWGIALDSGGWTICGQTGSSDMYSMVAAVFSDLDLLGTHTKNAAGTLTELSGHCPCSSGTCAWFPEPTDHYNVRCIPVGDDAFVMKLPFRQQ